MTKQIQFALRICAAILMLSGAMAARAADQPAEAAAKVDFAKDIAPILAERCVTCHGPQKQKGGLRLDAPSYLAAGSENGPVFVAGKPDESPIYTLVSLPADHADRMPAQGDPLSAEQIALIKRWVDEGAVLPAADAPASEPAPARGGGSPASEPAAAAPSVPEGPSVLEKLAEGLAPAPADALKAVQDLGALAMPLDMHTPLLSVNFQYIGDQVNDQTLDLLAPLAEHVTWLNLAGTGVTDAGLAKVAGLKKLTRLHLERTGVGDAGLAQLNGLTNLEYLNLYGTKVTDAGLDGLAALTNLKKLYLWNSQATQAGADRLKTALPALYVNLGTELVPPPAPAAAGALALALLFDKEGCCAKAQAEGKECDHPCCVEARAKGEVCAKCNPGAQAKAALIALFDKESCCDKAKAAGKDCDHPCCVEALAKGEVCVKCNPGAPRTKLAKMFDADGCCAKANAEGKNCDHPCCVEALAAGKLCPKCNPNGAKTQLAALFDTDGCCAKAAAEGKECEHPCCVEARAKLEVCLKCNPGAAPKPGEAPAAESAPAPAPEPAPAEDPNAKLAALFDAESCCAKAVAEGKTCDHACCAEARAKGDVCVKCNPGAVKKKLAVLFDAEGCCAKAAAEGKDCDHPCCVEAAAAGKVCGKCNPNGAKMQLTALFDKDGCCAKAAAESKDCDHPCCVEARAKFEVCLKCNPGAAPKPAEAPAAEPDPKAKLAELFDAGGCCAKACAEGKDCDHPCCVEAAAAGKLCPKCNPNGAKTLLISLFDKDRCCARALAEGKDCDHPCCVEARAKGEVCTKCNPEAAAKQEAAAKAPDSPTPAPDPADKPPGEGKVAGLLSFNRHIRPILADNCFQCHGPDNAARKADLRLDVRESALAVRKEGRAVIVPGKSAESELIRRITHHDPMEVMPPPASPAAAGRLTSNQIALLTRWIDEGAHYEAHWAYLAPERTEPPLVSDETWVINEVDRFILAKLDENGLRPSPEADRVTLIRRASFDLIGLPPTPDEVDAFVNDPDPNAFEKLVDRLLASPHFGERMAVHWLDVVRYADTNGYHSDEHRSVYPYRDYVIHAFNENKPFDQFTIEQLAGDLLPEATRDTRVASAYNRLNQLTAEGGAQAAEYLAKYAADRVRTTSTVWLGTTMGCAECHDHKYDPFTTKEFYQFAAFFADIEEKGVYSSGQRWEPVLELPSEEQESELAALTEAAAELQTQLDTPTEALATAQRDWEVSTIANLTTSYNDWTPLMPRAAVSANGATLAAGDDLVVTASGPNPANDVYTLTLQTNQRFITGMRLEAVPHPKTGKYSRGNGNFVLTGFEVAVNEGDTELPIKVRSAQADYDQPGYRVADAIDGDPATGWAVSGHEVNGVPRFAVFTFAQPIGGGPGTAVSVRLRFESRHAEHTLSQFRLSMTTVDTPALGAGGLPKEVLAALTTNEASRTEEQRESLARHYRNVAPELEDARRELKAKQDRISEIQAAIPYTLVTRAVEPREIRVLPRGNFLDLSGEVVTPNTPEALPALNVAGRRATRLDLAKWLMAPENPLPARVTMNRTWELFFGTGLSKVLDDVGTRGEWPTHPELLDWLAVEFRESGWDLKHMIRLMVTSAAYRQSSLATDELRRADPYNRLYARQVRRRLDAEFVRDNALSIAGLLSEKIGGRSVFPYQPDGYFANCNTFGGYLGWDTDHGEDQYRRGLYTYWKRSFLHPSMLALDAPSREECVADRVVSNTPMQALTLLNDPTYVEAARVFAERIIRECHGDAAARVTWAYRRALSRAPLPEEVETLAALCVEHARQYAADPDAARAVLAVGIAPVPDEIDPVELAAWTSVARTILNLHEAITRT